MRQSEDKLTFMQTLIMVSSTMIGAGVLTLSRSAAETDSPIGWIMILLQGVIFIIFSLLFLPFLQRNSGKTIFELNSIAAGKVVGFFLNVFISLYFIGIVCFQTRILGEVVGFFLLKNTPIFDTTFAIIRRILNKQPISAPDKSHIHHRLMAFGLSHRMSVLVIYLIGFIFSISAIVLKSATIWLSLFIIFILIIFMQIIAEVTGLVNEKFKPFTKFYKRLVKRN